MPTTIRTQPKLTKLGGIPTDAVTKYPTATRIMPSTSSAKPIPRIVAKLYNLNWLASEISL